MAREKRQISPTGIYHVLLRGIDELFSEKDDFEEFIAVLERYFENADSKLLGYALMKNRVHMIIDEGNNRISAVMKPICTSYARYYNRVHDVQGKLFYDRYKSEPVFDEENLQEIKGFLNSVPSDYKGGVEDCGINESLSCIDDYCRMTDEELKNYIESIFKCSILKMPKEKRKALAEKIISGKRISAGRIYNLFELGRKTAVKNSSDVIENKPEKKKEQEEKKEQNKNSGLSVWLL